MKKVFFYILFAAVILSTACVYASDGIYAVYSDGSIFVSGSTEAERITAAVYRLSGDTISNEDIVYLNQFSLDGADFALSLNTALSELDDGEYYAAVGGSGIETAAKVLIVIGGNEIYYILGDVDGDGMLTAADASFVLQYVLDKDGFPLDERQLLAAAVTNESVITAENSAVILQKVLDDDYIFPAER